jgi:capsid protein
MLDLGSGIVSYARPGENVTPVTPSRPTSNFDPFITSVLKMMGPAVGFPYELLVQYFQASFNASQAAINVANSNFKVKRSGLVHDFCQPIYEAFMDEAVMRNWLDRPGYFDDVVTRRAYTRAKWNGPGMPHINLGKARRTIRSASGGGGGDDANGKTYRKRGGCPDGRKRRTKYLI